MSAAPDLVDSVGFRRGVMAATALGAVIRLAMWLSKRHHQLLLNDSLYYAVQASNNAAGKWFREAAGPFSGWGVGPGAEHPPLTSIVLTPAGLASNPEAWMRLTMSLIGIAVIPLIALVGRTVGNAACRAVGYQAGGARVGIIAAVIAAVYPNIWMSDSLIMSETLSLLLITVCLLAGLRHQRTYSVGSAMLLGLAIGIAAHARSEVLVFAPMLALIGVLRHDLRRWIPRAAALLAITMLTVLPWIVFNTHRFGSPVLMSTNDGNTWLGANCPETYAGQELGGWTLVCLADAKPPVGENNAERSVRRRQTAFAFAHQHLGSLPKVAVARVARALDIFGLNSLVRADTGEERPRLAVWLGMACWWVLAPMAAVGWWQNRRRLSRVLLVPVAATLIVTLVFYGSHRLRAPVEPVVVILAAVFLAGLRRAPDGVSGAAAESPTSTA